MIELSRTHERGFDYFRGGRCGYPANLTAAVATFLFLPNRPLRILGAGKGAFSIRPPPDMEEALDLYHRKKWPQARAAIGTAGARTDYGKGLLAKLAWVEDHVRKSLTVIKSDVETGRFKTATERLDDLIAFYGGEPAGAAQARKAIAGRTSQPPAPKRVPVFDESYRVPGLQYTGAWEEDPVALNVTSFEGMPTMEVARFLGHCHGYVFEAAVKVLVERDEDLTPLIRKLLKDKHPYIRSGALRLLRESLLPEQERGTWGGKTELSDDQYRQFMEIVHPVLNDTHMDVHFELAGCLKAFGSRSAEMDAAILRIATEGPLASRLKLVDALGAISDAKTKFAASRALLRSPVPANRSRGYENCMMLAKEFGYDWGAADLESFKLPPDGLEILNDMGYHVRHVMKGPGGHTDILAHLAAACWGPDVQELEHVLPALTRVFVRSKDQNWTWVATDITRFLVRELFKHAEKKRLRAAIDKEKHWLATAPEESFVATYNREWCEKNIAELERILAGEATDDVTEGIPVRKLLDNPPAIPIVTLRHGNSFWMGGDMPKLAYQRRKSGAGRLVSGSKRTGSFPGGADLLAARRGIESVAARSGYDVSRTELLTEGPIRDVHRKYPGEKYVFLVSVQPVRLRFSFGNKFVCLGDALIHDGRSYERGMQVVEPQKPHILAAGGFYCTFPIPDGMKEGSPEWNALVEKKIGQAFYEQILVPFAEQIKTGKGL